MSSGIDRDQWLAALTAAGVALPDDDPQALTVREFAAMFHCHKDVASRQLLALVAGGQATRTIKRFRDAAGRWQRAAAYRLEAK